MIERQFSAGVINGIVNHPSIYPWICGPLTDEIDLSESIRSGQYIALFGEHGGFLFWKLAEGVYDAHSAVLPSGRGKWALKAAREALHVMFTQEHALEIIMAAPKGNLAVLALIRSLKAKLRGTINEAWWLNDAPVASDIYSLTKTDWEQCLLPHH